MTPAGDSSRLVILAAGGVLTRRTGKGREIALIYRERYREWSLPKGKLDPGETFEQAAVREVREETGCSAAIEGFLGAIDYRTTSGGPKVVLFFEMALERETPFEPNEEIQQLAWLSPERALERLRHAGERAILERYLEKRR